MSEEHKREEECRCLPLGDVLSYLPGVSEELRNDLVNALTAAR